MKYIVLFLFRNGVSQIVKTSEKRVFKNENQFESLSDLLYPAN